MFQLKQAQTQQMIDTEQARLMRIAARLRQIEQEGKMPAYEVLLKQVDALLVASVREIVPLLGGLERSYGKIAAYLDQQGVQPGSPALLLLYSRSEQRDDGLYIDVEAAIPLPTALPGNEQITIRTLPGGLVASTIHTGYDLATALFRNRVINSDQYDDDEQAHTASQRAAVPARSRQYCQQVSRIGETR